MRRCAVYAALALSAGSAVYAQTAGPQPTYIYSYEGQSVDPSIFSAVSTAGDPARSLMQSNAGPDTATGLVPPFPTTATAEPVSAPQATSDLQFSSGSPGVVLSSNTRAPYVASGTIDTTRLEPSASASGQSSGASLSYRQPSTTALVASVGVGLVGAVVAHLIVF
ncbi:hypothetical protein OIV83_001213 [Microbotryomycetes sp. JL201]|nr:hypothetical protein OIV83_001213 [Microbotryomycetes sp. JL201]